MREITDAGDVPGLHTSATAKADRRLEAGAMSSREERMQKALAALRGGDASAAASMLEQLIAEGPVAAAASESVSPSSALIL
jgi:Tfp pilus assembly protein PilF